MIAGVTIAALLSEVARCGGYVRGGAEESRVMIFLVIDANCGDGGRIDLRGGIARR